MTTQTVLQEVAAERDYQNNKWGTSFDDKNTAYNWFGYIAAYGSRNLTGTPEDKFNEAFRTDMLKVAALAVAAVEAFDRTKGE